MRRWIKTKVTDTKAHLCIEMSGLYCQLDLHYQNSELSCIGKRVGLCAATDATSRLVRH